MESIAIIDMAINHSWRADKWTSTNWHAAMLRIKNNKHSPRKFIAMLLIYDLIDHNQTDGNLYCILNIVYLAVRAVSGMLRH